MFYCDSAFTTLNNWSVIWNLIAKLPVRIIKTAMCQLLLMRKLIWYPSTIIYSCCGYFLRKRRQLTWCCLLPVLSYMPKLMDIQSIRTTCLSVWALGVARDRFPLVAEGYTHHDSCSCFRCSASSLYRFHCLHFWDYFVAFNILHLIMLEAKDITCQAKFQSINPEDDFYGTYTATNLHLVARLWPALC